MQIYIDIKSCFHHSRVSTAECSTHCSHTWKLISFSCMANWQGAPFQRSLSLDGLLIFNTGLPSAGEGEGETKWVGSVDPAPGIAPTSSSHFTALVCDAAGRCGFIPSQTHTVTVLLRVWGLQAVSCPLQQLFMVLFATSAKAEKPGGFKKWSERLRENFVESFCCCLLFLSIVETELENWREEICSRDYYSKLKGVMITRSRDAIRSGYITCEKVNNRKSLG